MNTMGAERYRCVLGAVLALAFSVAALGVEKPTSPQKTCVTPDCHASYAKKAFVHGPVSLGDCKSCHEEADATAHKYKLTRQGKDLCEYCHLEQAAKKNVHEPLKTGQCTECHDPHSGDTKALIRAKTVGELCAKCHQIGKDLRFLHGPVAVGECTICHACGHRRSGEAAAPGAGESVLLLPQRHEGGTLTVRVRARAGEKCLHRLS